MKIEHQNNNLTSKEVYITFTIIAFFSFILGNILYNGFVTPTCQENDYEIIGVESGTIVDLHHFGKSTEITFEKAEFYGRKLLINERVYLQIGQDYEIVYGEVVQNMSWLRLGFVNCINHGVIVKALSISEMSDGK